MSTFYIRNGVPCFRINKRKIDSLCSAPIVLAEVFEKGEFVVREFPLERNAEEIKKGEEFVVGVDLNDVIIRNIAIFERNTLSSTTSNLSSLFSHEDGFLVFDKNSYDYWIKGTREVDKETLLYIMLQSFNHLEDLNMKTACFVVFIYKSIELKADNLLKDALERCSLIMDNIDVLLKIKGSTPKDDGTQQALSFFTALWHAYVYLEMFDSFKDIIEKSCFFLDHEKLDHKVTYAVNYSKLLAFKSYIALISNDFSVAKKLSEISYLYSIKLIAKLDMYQPSDTVLNDLIKALSVARKTAAIYKYINSKSYLNRENGVVKAKLSQKKKIVERTRKILEVHKFVVGLPRVEGKEFELKLSKALVYYKKVDL